MPNKAYYDLHIHSCLSPCGDNDMTPGNIAGMSMLKGLNIVALTDHNSFLNCPAFFSFAADMGLIPVAGAEITTTEDIHVLSLFESLEGAMDFNSFIDAKKYKIKNDSAIFGNQYIVDSKDSVIGEEEHLLINAIDISVDDICSQVKKFSGIAIPAHIDKISNGIISVLGTVPDCGFSAFEVSDIDKKHELADKYSILKNRCFVTNSDAHYLWDINEKLNYIEIFSDFDDISGVTQELFRFLRGEP